MQNNQRILSIDAFRGITIFTMVFVNELAGMRSIPQWMKHMPATADAMTFVDLVFPAFLFIVGMSIPFALQNRLQKGDSIWQLQGHIIWRSLGLLTLGFFLVNGEEGLNAKATGLQLHAWMLPDWRPKLKSARVCKKIPNKDFPDQQTKESLCI